MASQAGRLILSLFTLIAEVDPSGSQIIVGFASGVVRQYAFVAHTNELLLVAAFKVCACDWCHFTVQPHTKAIVRVAVSSCGKFLVTASEDNSLFFFSSDNARFSPIGFVETPSRPNDVHWCPVVDSRKLLVCCEDGSVFELVAPQVCSCFRVVC